MKLFKQHIIGKDSAMVMKGVGIILIVMHNYCHNIYPATKENEFSFSLQRSLDYFSSLFHWDHPFINFFSYWGHIGVALFVFLTAYGLTRKSITTPASLGVGFSGGASFVWQRAKRLLSLMLTAIMLYIIGNVIYKLIFTTGDTLYIYIPKKDLWVFSLINNPLRPLTKAYYIFGPWWYWGLAFQLILLYRIAVHNRHIRWTIGLTIVSIAIGVFLAATHANEETMTYFKENFIGWMLPFAAGIVMGRREMSCTWITTLASFLLLIASCFNIYLWLFSSLFATLFLVGIIQSIHIPQITKPLSFVGRYSMYVFATHTTVRLWLQGITTMENFWQLLPIYLILMVLFAFLGRQVHQRLFTQTASTMTSVKK